jgi:arginine repressor
MGVQKIAKALRAQGVEISGPTVSARLKELQGQLSFIM